VIQERKAHGDGLVGHERFLGMKAGSGPIGIVDHSRHGSLLYPGADPRGADQRDPHHSPTFLIVPPTFHHHPLA
jgi:hypothetical protein